jgi:hypothetical protein
MGNTLFIPICLIIFGLGLIVLSAFRLARHNHGKSNFIVYNKETGQVEDTESPLPVFLLFLLFWAVLSFFLLTGTGPHIMRMPWG